MFLGEWGLTPHASPQKGRGSRRCGIGVRLHSVEAGDHSGGSGGVGGARSVLSQLEAGRAGIVHGRRGLGDMVCGWEWEPRLAYDMFKHESVRAMHCGTRAVDAATHSRVTQMAQTVGALAAYTQQTGMALPIRWATCTRTNTMTGGTSIT